VTEVLRALVPEIKSMRAEEIKVKAGKAQAPVQRWRP
jgi:hypothetical protein